ncbi:MAG: L-threonylcarbamoyladenylate synthase [bacterium]
MQRISLSPAASHQELADALSTAAAALFAGGLVIYPTETLYGAGVDATNRDAVSKLLKFKERPPGKAISVLVADQDAAEKLVDLNETALNLYNTYLPGPVTVVSQSKGTVDPRLVSEFGTLGIRISSGLIAQDLAKTFQKPISATSANAAGKARPYSVDGLLEALSESQRGLIDLIIDVGTLPPTEPSTVIDTTTEVQKVLRAGMDFHQVVPDILSESEEETIAIGRDFGNSFLHAVAEKPVVFALEGEMGAGKTRFAKGVAEALGVDAVVSSPTYTLVKEYEGSKGRLVHLDCWRTPEITADELMLDDYLKPGTILVIEWAKPLLPYLQSQQVVGHHIFIEERGEQSRQIKVAKI